MTDYRRRLGSDKGDVRLRNPRHRYRMQISAPTDIADCAMWFDASLGVTTPMGSILSVWADQSGNSRDLSRLVAPDMRGAAWDNAVTYYTKWTVVEGAAIYEAKRDNLNKQPSLNGADWLDITADVTRVYDAGTEYDPKDIVFEANLSNAWASLATQTGVAPAGATWSILNDAAMGPSNGINTLNSLPVITFTADYTKNTGDRMETAWDATGLAYPLTYFVLMRRDTITADPDDLTGSFAIDSVGYTDTQTVRLSHNKSQDQRRLVFGTAGRLNYGAVETGVWALHEMVLRQNPAASQVWVNGQLKAQAVLGAGDEENMKGLVIGDKAAHETGAERYGAGNWFDGDIAAAIIYERDVFLDERLAVREYFQDRYAFLP